MAGLIYGPTHRLHSACRRSGDGTVALPVTAATGVGEDVPYSNHPIVTPISPSSAVAYRVLLGICPPIALGGGTAFLARPR